MNNIPFLGLEVVVVHPVDGLFRLVEFSYYLFLPSSIVLLEVLLAYILRLGQLGDILKASQLDLVATKVDESVGKQAHYLFEYLINYVVCP